MTPENRLSKGPCAGRLQGKVALVTGAGGAQGQVVSLLFAKAGARVFASDVNAATLEETRAMAVQRGLSINVATVDASSPKQVADRGADAVQKNGRIDVLNNNGAGVHMAPFEDRGGKPRRDCFSCNANERTKQWHSFATFGTARPGARSSTART